MTATAIQAASMFSLSPHVSLNDLRMSDTATPLYAHEKRFIAETVQPMYEEYTRLGEGWTERWQFAPGQLEALEAAKERAKAEGLWNFSLPDAGAGKGLTAPAGRSGRERIVHP